MLLDNFKSLLSFTQNMNFVNVLGNTVSKSKVLQGCGLYNGFQGSNNTVVNGHSRYGTTCFNYNATTTANGFKNEQTTYHWNNVVCCTTESTSTNNEGSTNRRQNGFTLFVGNGTAEPKADDYKLESPLVLNVTTYFKSVLFSDSSLQPMPELELSQYIALNCSNAKSAVYSFSASLHTLCTCLINASFFPLLNISTILGTINSSITASIAITAKSSTKVNPFLFFLFIIGHLPLLYKYIIY